MHFTFHARQGRDNNFHLIRHIAAIMVVLTHSYSVTTGVYEDEPLVMWLGLSIGHYAVDIFFVLSGFLVVQSLLRRGDLLDFAVARFLRIFPALVAAVLLSALVLGPMVTSLTPAAYFADSQLWKYILGVTTTLATKTALPGVFTHAPEAAIVNLPLWTLKYEVFAYCLLMAVFAIAIRSGKWFLAACAAGITIAYIAGRLGTPWPASNSAINNLLHLSYVFLLGVTGFVFRKKIPLHPMGVFLLLGLAVAARPTFFNEFTDSLFVAYTVLWFAFLPLYDLKSQPGAKRTSKPADISYGLYIFAFPIQQALNQIAPGTHPLLLFLAAMCLTAPLAWLSWHLIEKHCIAARPAVSAFARKRIDHLLGRAPVIFDGQASR